MKAAQKTKKREVQVRLVALGRMLTTDYTDYTDYE